MRIPSLPLPDVMCIPLEPDGCGKVALVDADDFWWLADIPWRYHSLGYAFVNLGRDGNGKQRIVMMHRLIVGPDGECTDHVNGDKLDNRRSNLRACTAQQNAWNRRARRTHRGKRRPLRFKGVRFVTLDSWKAELKLNGQRHSAGPFRSAEEAAHAYDELARQFFGEFARLNFPTEGEQAA